MNIPLKNVIELLTKLGFRDKGDFFERNLYGVMAKVVVDCSKSYESPKITIDSDWGIPDNYPKTCKDFNDLKESWDDIAHFYQTQKQQCISDQQRAKAEGWRMADPGINLNDKVLFTEDVK